MLGHNGAGITVKHTPSSLYVFFVKGGMAVKFVFTDCIQIIIKKSRF